jgi:hypothetical protein
MTMFTTFTGMNSMPDVCLFSDFITSTAPFNTAVSSALGAATVDNSNSTNVLGKAQISIASATSAGVFQYAGIYMAPAQTAAGAALTRNFRLGKGEVDIYGSGITLGTSAAAGHMTSFGVSTGDYSTATVPATDFAGFFVTGPKTNWCYGVVINSVLTSFDTTLPKVQPQSFQVIISKNASKTSFIANGKDLGSIDAQLRTSAAVLPAFEVKDIVSGGSGSALPCSIDQLTVRLRIER